MIGGLERFREHFRGLTEHFALIGGTACHEQFAIIAAIEDFMDEVPAMPELFARLKGCYQLKSP